MAEAFNVRVSWKLSGAYGFFYLGDQKGVYKDAGLELKLGEGASSQAALGGLIQGQEDVVVMPGIFAVSAIQKGMPVKIIGVYQPSTPIALISHPDNPVNTPKDLQRAEEHYAAHPELRPTLARRARSVPSAQRTGGGGLGEPGGSPSSEQEPTA